MVVYQGNQRDPSELHDTVQVVSFLSRVSTIFFPMSGLFLSMTNLKI